MKRITLTALAIFCMFIGTAMATDCCPECGDVCDELIVDCIGCELIDVTGTPQMTITAGGTIEMNQLQIENFDIVDCLATGDFASAQKVMANLSLSDEGIDTANGSIQTIMAQYHEFNAADTVAGFDVMQTGTQFESFSAYAGANDGQDALINAEQVDMAHMYNEVYSNGLESGATAASCLDAELMGLDLQLHAQQLNTFGYSLSDGNSWQQGQGVIQFTVNPVATP